QNVVTYNVRVSLSNPEHILLPGMTAYVSIGVASRQDVLLVPNAALRFRPPDGNPQGNGAAGQRPGGEAAEGKGRKRDAASGTVYRVEHGELKAIPVPLGITDQRNSEVLGGDLKAGDTVVVGENIAPSNGKPSSVGMRLF
ncbi:MAG: efflux RND transporter periplasmic adaptor subunit, partial [Candidatus Accumulibacter sp.]|nr:efflux RND transporter periplasmic adaptor subunit [Accumulibacter sp.]